MAANSKSRGIASFGKRVVTQICSSTSRDPTTLSASSLLSQRRAAHTSVYDKNPDEHISPSIVPDDVIRPQSDKYWSPHPKTGVFGPATEHNTTAGGKTGMPADGGESSVLEENAWFRPTSLEDLEKPDKL